MNNFKLSLFLALVGYIAAQNPVKVDVYYETKCPDSIDFIVNQLWSTYQQVSDIFTTNFYPYGFATSTANGSSWDFECQHGPEECKGNIIHACAIKYYPSNADNVPFVSCSMSKPDPPAAGEMCATQYGLDWDNYINPCATSTMGPQLLHDNGVITDSLSPAVTWMPWIIINDVYSEANEIAASTNFLKLVCDTYNGTKPAACAAA